MTIPRLFLYAMCYSLALDAAWGAQAGSPDFSCGIYQLHGRLKVYENGVRALELFPDTSARAEIALSKLSVGDAAAYSEKNVELEVEIDRAGKSEDVRARVLKPVRTATRSIIESSPVQLLRSKPCKK